MLIWQLPAASFQFLTYTKDQNIEKYRYESKIGSGIFVPAYEKSDWTRQFNKESQNSF